MKLEKLQKYWVMKKRNLNILKFVLLLGVVIFLYSFGNKRNSKRNVSKVNIEFIDTNSPFITHKTVNKLLIQSPDTLMDIALEGLDLMSMEQRLNQNPMIRKSEVYVTIDGVLGAKIEQRDPIGRVLASNEVYYIDADGKAMPLSEVYSARVPIVTGVVEEDLEAITPLLLKIREDEFMNRMVVGLNQTKNGEVELELRNLRLKALFGKPNQIDKKFQNFKAFYKKTKQDSTIYGYKKINLKFENQVIATKKEYNGK